MWVIYLRCETTWLTSHVVSCRLFTPTPPSLNSMTRVTGRVEGREGIKDRNQSPSQIERRQKREDCLNTWRELLSYQILYSMSLQFVFWDPIQTRPRGLSGNADTITTREEFLHRATDDDTLSDTKGRPWRGKTRRETRSKKTTTEGLMAKWNE